MARGNNRAINVKIPTIKVIESLSASLAKREEEIKNYPKLLAEYQTAHAAWQKDMVKLIDISKPTEIDIRTWRNNSSIMLTFKVDESKLTEAPTAPDSPDNWKFKEETEELRNAIRILKMTEEEHVSTSTYNSVAKFL